MKCDEKAFGGFNAAEKAEGRSDRVQVSSINRGGARGDGDEFMETLMKIPSITAAGLLRSLALLSMCVGFFILYFYSLFLFF